MAGRQTVVSGRDNKLKSHTAAVQQVTMRLYTRFESIRYSIAQRTVSERNGIWLSDTIKIGETLRILLAEY